jgi:hypothetical protein
MKTNLALATLVCGFPRYVASRHLENVSLFGELTTGWFTMP